MTIADAIKNNSFYDYPGEANAIVVGDAKGRYNYILSFSVSTFNFDEIAASKIRALSVSHYKKDSV